MSDRKHEAAFIPCGDSFEKMSEIREEELEKVTGGSLGTGVGKCPHCGGRIIFMYNEKTGSMDLPRCISCGK